MKIKKPSPLEVFVLVVIIAAFFALLLPKVMRAPSKHAPIRTPPGVSTALMQIRRASFDYWISKGEVPSSLKDLVGMIVLDSEGRKMPFSMEALAQEAGTNTTVVGYFPEFRALSYGATLTDQIVLACVPELNDSGFYRVIFLDGKIQRIHSLELEKMIAHLQSLLQQEHERKRVTH